VLERQAAERFAEVGTTTIEYVGDFVWTHSNPRSAIGDMVLSNDILTQRDEGQVCQVVQAG
jgi:hypothetical protein